jgi:prevent-host-death family protein
MKTVGAYEAKTHLSDLLDEVEAGTDITITRYGRPVARLLPAEEDSSASTEETISTIRSFREGNKLGDDELSSLIEEGRA